MTYLSNSINELSAKIFEVIPICVDLSLFVDVTDSSSTDANAIGAMGTLLSGWCHTDRLPRTMALSKDVFGNCFNIIISKDDSVELVRQISKEGI